MPPERVPKIESRNESASVDEAIKTFLPRDENERIEYFGTSTSSFQNEPLIYNENGEPKVLSDWELELVKKQSGEKSGIPEADLHNLPQFSKHAESYIDRAKELGDNMYRLSFEMPRLCPGPDTFDEEQMTEYVEALALIKARGMEPFVTLHHFVMPRFLTDVDEHHAIKSGGWESPEAIKTFRFYVEHVARFLADDDKVRPALLKAGLTKESQDRILDEGLAQYFMSINEPSTTFVNSYLVGTFPPYKKVNLVGLKKTLDRMVEAHDISYNELKEGLKDKSQEPQVGMGYNWPEYEEMGRSIARAFDHYYTDKFERDGAYSDFLGFQYYFRLSLPFQHKNAPTRDWGDHPEFGDIYPEGMKKRLEELTTRYPHKDIFVSEFGFSDKDDLRRPYWLLETMRYILEAKREGVPVKGMLQWSLVNNLEWNLGMSQHFGLFDEADLDTPLVSSQDGIRSWEVWQSAVEVLRSENPSGESIERLARCYRSAYNQYKNAGGVY